MEIWTVRTKFEAFECKFELVIINSNDSNENSNNSKAFEWKFEPFEKDWKHSNLNPPNEIRRIQMHILAIEKEFWPFECKLEPFEQNSKHSN